MIDILINTLCYTIIFFLNMTLAVIFVSFLVNFWETSLEWWDKVFWKLHKIKSGE